MTPRNDLQKPSRKFFLCLLLLSTLTVLTSCYAGSDPSPVRNAPDSSGSTRVSVLTYHNNNFRTGLNPNETILTPANVNPKQFGKIGTLSVSGLVDAEPLYVSDLNINGKARNVIFVATEHDMVYAFDASNDTQIWAASMLAKFPGETPSDEHRCPQVAPVIGITSTPVIDLKAGPHGTIFVMAMSKDTSGDYHQRMHALDLATGADRMAPREVHATYPGKGTGSSGGIQTFNPGSYEERAALLLSKGVIYTTWTSHCDFAPYTSWVMGYSESNLNQLTVLNLTPNGTTQRGKEGGIWMTGDGPAVDRSGNIYLLVGNGTFDTNLNSKGFPAEGDYGNSFVKLSTKGHKLAVADYFAMNNSTGTADSESSRDTDLGSGGEMLLPDIRDSSGKVLHLAVGAGKDTNIYIVNRHDMGKYKPNDAGIYQRLTGVLPGGVWSSPAYFDNAVYYDSVSHPMKIFPISNGKLASAPSSQTKSSFGYPSVTPSISSDGTTNGIVWAVVAGPAAGFRFTGSSTGTLSAYDATDLSKELYNSNMAAGSRDTYPTDRSDKFITPLIAGGKVYVGTPNAVVVFGLLKQ
ncbi:MAG: pyrrolo-quinoline quinone [Candidatus Acidiferrales bacterium]